VEEDEEGCDECALRCEVLGALYRITSRLAPAATVRAISIIFHSLLDHHGLISRSSGYMEGLSDGVRKTIEGLKGVDVEHLAIFKQFKKESLELEAKV